MRVTNREPCHKSEDKCGKRLGRLTVDDISDGFQTSTTDRPFVDIHFLRPLVDQIQKEVASKVETSINPSGN